MFRKGDGFPVFSDRIEAENRSEHDWLIKAARRLWGTPDDPPESWPPKAEELLSVEFDDVYGNFPKWKAHPRGGIIVYSTEGCHLRSIPPLVQLYLARYHSDWVWHLQWAIINEGPVPGGFGGGAMVVTHDRVAWHDTGEFVVGMLEAYDLQHF